MSQPLAGPTNRAAQQNLNNVSQARLVLSIIKRSPHRGAKLARKLFDIFHPFGLTAYAAAHGIHHVNLSQGLAKPHLEGSSQKARIWPMVAEYFGLEVDDFFTPLDPAVSASIPHLPAPKHPNRESEITETVNSHA